LIFFTYNENMSGERIVNIMMLELSSEKLLLEETLEQIINSDKDPKIKTKEIKEVLNKLAINEGATSIWGRQTSEIIEEKEK